MKELSMTIRIIILLPICHYIASCSFVDACLIMQLIPASGILSLKFVPNQLNNY